MKAIRLTRPFFVAAGEICPTFASANEDQDDDEDDDEDDDDEELGRAGAEGFTDFLAFDFGFAAANFVPFTMTKVNLWQRNHHCEVVSDAFLAPQKMHVLSGKKFKSRKFLKGKKTDGEFWVDKKSIFLNSIQKIYFRVDFF